MKQPKIPALFEEIILNWNEFDKVKRAKVIDYDTAKELRRRKRELMVAADKYVANQRGGNVN